MAETPDSQIALMFSFYEGLRQKGPGSEASTLKALSMLDGLPPSPRIVDFGCGAGAASLVIVRATQCSVTAVDIHQPFLDELEDLATSEGLMDRIRTVQGDMADPGFPDASFDLVWSEGAVYNIGFEEGLRRWRRLLNSDGFVAVTEATWLSESPHRKAVEFFATEYPAMTNIEDNVKKVRSAGYEAVGHFALPSADWQNYYDPLEKHIADFRAKHSEYGEALSMLDSLQQEIDLWKECGDSYGYVFYLGRLL